VQARGRIVVLVLAGVAFGTAACGRDRSGQALYARSCARCHGAAGLPTEAALRMGTPNFTDAAWQRQHTDDQIRRKIRDGGGRGSLMPSFEGLGASDLEGLVAYVRSLGAPK
jgi:mono/diheme cytochrome c family protein